MLQCGTHTTRHDGVMENTSFVADTAARLYAEHHFSVVYKLADREPGHNSGRHRDGQGSLRLQAPQ